MENDKQDIFFKDDIVDGLTGCSSDKTYVPPKEENIRERLEWFKDQKLALMMHWGLYSELGICESWPLSDEDASWSRADCDWDYGTPDEFRKKYYGLKRSFNPIRFEPKKWARFVKENGFKYFVFTTKHMDGFCLFDSKATDFKVTDENCAFSTHKYANITKHLFDAMRDEGIAIAAYYCKPDLHCPWYWAENQQLPVGHWRNPTYDVPKHPEIWNSFVKYTHDNVMELVKNYGKLDIIWLDGGQVTVKNGQDAKIPELIDEARKIQPWLICADRTAGGPYENYITPEQSIPDRPITVPWESCITLGNDWGFHFDEVYKSSRELIKMLIDVVSNGGNLAINIGPQPDGRLPKQAMDIISEMGEWLKENGEAIYSTRICEPYLVGKTGFTRPKDSSCVYALYKVAQDEKLSNELFIPYNKEVSSISLLDGTALGIKKAEGGYNVLLADKFIGTSPLALVLKIQ